MNHIIKLTIQGISFILSQLADSDCKFLWVTTPDYSRQVYVGPAYEKIFGKPCADLYKDPAAWRSSLDDSEQEQITKLFKSRSPSNFDTLNTVFYRIHDSNGKLRWLKDTCFYLFNYSGMQIAAAGIVEDITELQWKKELCKQNNQQEIYTVFTQELVNKFTDELNISLEKISNPLEKNNGKKSPETNDVNSIRIVLTSTGEMVKLTQREADCLFHLSNGRSGKIIARILSISPRTVEVHIENIKKKLKCHSRVGLMSKFCAIVM